MNARRLTFIARTCAMLLCFAPGCVGSSRTWIPGPWINDYEAAEKSQAESGSTLLVYYRTTDQTHSDAMAEILRSRKFRERTDRWVRCQLFQSFEPDRRFVAQFGVERAPALIVVHPDRTYHSRSGPLGAAQIEQFLDAAKPPGAPPSVNPYLPRAAAYAWYRALPAAEEAARRAGKPVLVVLNRLWTWDAIKLDEMLARKVVYTRFGGMIHCRPDPLLGSVAQVGSRFGVDNFPAMVILRPDGSFATMELPNSVEAIVRFADSARVAGGGASAAIGMSDVE